MYSLHGFRELPSVAILVVLLALAVLLAVPARCCVLCAFPIGLVLIGANARIVDAQKLDASLAGADIDVLVRIIDFPQRRGEQLRILAGPVSATHLPDRLRLSWYDAASSPRIGECWRLRVRLRRPRGLANPGGFDYEGWLFRNRIGATGYVRDGQQAESCSQTPSIQALRGHIAGRIADLLPDDAAAAVVLAITVGARQHIGADDWQRYAVSGTSHLMAISGMHIGLAAGAAYFLARVGLACLWRRGNHRLAAALVALLVAVVYAALSGFAVPARRALTMLALAMLAVLLRRRTSPGHLLGLAAVIVASTSPLDVLSPGFQLSFAAVAVLLFLARRRRSTPGPSPSSSVIGALRSLSVLQFALLAGLLPLGAVLFGRIAWLAPAVNLAVLPVFNFVTVPAALLGLLLDGPLSPVGDALLRLAWRGTHMILQIVDAASDVPGAHIAVSSLHRMALLVACLPVLWVVLPVAWPGRRVAWIAAAATALYAPERPADGCVDIHTLDVGQGLASVVVTREHIMVFDTGPAFRSDTDAARLVLTPFLRRLGARSIDILVISHADLDHAGGVPSLQDEWTIEAVLAGEATPRSEQWAVPCVLGQLWHWDGIDFRVLHPGDRPVKGNNASCVIEIQSGEYRALLTGDIEARSERRLLRADLLSSTDLVLMPHHGSATSSSERFVQAVAPATAIASTGFANRWRMPREVVLERWRAQGANTYNTAIDGAVSFRLCADSGVVLRQRARHAQRKVWHEMQPHAW
jgi:competence protein ComEC